MVNGDLWEMADEAEVRLKRIQRLIEKMDAEIGAARTEIQKLMETLDHDQK